MTGTKNIRSAICLAGGGVTGAMYEVGVLAALEDYFEDFAASDFDLFIGSSSGACVATGLAGGIPALRMYRALLDPADDFFPFQRQHLMKLDLRELTRVFSSASKAFRRIVGQVAIKPLRTDVWNEIDRLWDSLPAGVFTTDAFEQFFFDFMTRRGVPKSFADMPRDLLLIANDLDGGERVVFGRDVDENSASVVNVPVAKAVAASVATPMLFAPVRIGGRDLIAGGPGEVGHVDLAVENGCEVVLVINAMVPVRTNPTERAVPTGHGPMPRVRDKGLLWVYSQSWRLMTEARLQKGLAGYRAEHPDVTVHLLEPERDNATMFMHSPMNFAARRVILEDGYRSTTAMLRADESPLRDSIERLGFVAKRPSMLPGA